MSRFSQILLLLLAAGMVACGGDDDASDGFIPVADAGMGADSGPDGLPAGCAYGETSDATNDGTPEATGIAISAGGGTKTVCGRIDPAQQNQLNAIADLDAFEFTVEGAENARIPYRVVLASPSGADLAGFGAVLQFLPEGGEPAGVATLPFQNGYGLATNFYFIPGRFRLLVLAGNDPLPAGPVDYKVYIGEPLPCETGAATHTEADESGAAHRANDVVSVAYTPGANITLTAAEDTADATGITLAPNAPVHLAGNSADVAADGDGYRDRDTYQVAVGAGVTEIDVRLSWPDGDVDMDSFVFASGALAPVLGRGNMISTTDDERFTLRVSEGDLWLWAGTFNVEAEITLPVDYTLTICPRSAP
jgi:hypothetical protein